MRTSAFASAAAIAVAAGSLVEASNSHNAIRRPALPRRLDTQADALSDPVAERGLLDALFGRYSGTGTWYGVGVSMGACGSWTSPDSRAVALNIGLYGNENGVSGWCGKKLRITANGKTSIATVVDCCPTCPGDGDLDMSKTLFQDFGILDDGVLDIHWSWVGAGGDGGDDNGGGHSASSHHNNKNDDDNNDKPKPKPKPKPKTTQKPKPTHTSTTTTTTSTSTTSSTKTKTKTKSKSKTKSHKAQKTTDASNLSNLQNVIDGFQHMALAQQAST